MILTIIFIAFSALGETDPVEFFENLREVVFNLPAAQSFYGDYTFIEGEDTTSGQYFLMPPHGTFITADDTVKFVAMSEYDDPWFFILIERSPFNREHFYDIQFIGDSASFVLADYLSRDPKKPNISMVYDRNIYEPYSMTLFWPDSVNHAFPGADMIKYELYITDRMSIAPKRRDYFNKADDIVETMIYETIEIPGHTPPDSVIISFLMGTTDLEGKGK